jgi:hypothetical protein
LNDAAVKESPVLDREQITYELMNDTRPIGPDGCSNQDRILYVVEVFECEVIDLTSTYDFTNAVRCKDTSVVEATKHLALLQLDYHSRLHYHNHITTDELNFHTATLILAIQRINWHLDHLKRDVPTPPFPFIH